MAIDGIHGKLPGVLLPFTGRSFDAQEKIAAKSPVKELPDSLDVSPGSSEFSRVRKMVNAIPDFRLDRVNHLAKQIEEGTYNLKGELIADALIRKNLIDLNA